MSEREDIVDGISGAIVPRLEPTETALLVIDLQNDFCHRNGFFGRSGHDVSSCAALADRISTLIGAVRLSGALIVYTRSVNDDPPRHRLVPRRFRSASDTYSFEAGVSGTERFSGRVWGSQLVEAVSPIEGESVIDKSRYNAFYGTGLQNTLEARGITTVVLAGVATHVCVDTTARDAYVRGFDVLVLSDYVAAFDNERELSDASLQTLDLLFGVVAPSETFLAALGVDAGGDRVRA